MLVFALFLSPGPGGEGGPGLLCDAVADPDDPAARRRRLPTYFPSTETLGADEMRITALGTGLPRL